MSVRIMKAVWDAKLPATITAKRTSTVKMVLLKLADNSNDEGKCWPSIDRIAHETGMSYRSVTRCLAELEQTNLIARVGNWKAGKKHNTYWINIRLLDDLANPYERKEKTDEPENPFTDGSSCQSDRSSCPIDRVIMTGEPSVNHHRTTNITDIVKNDEQSIADLDPAEYPHCYAITEAMQEMKEQGYRLTVCKLRASEWSECERLMAETGMDDHQQFLQTWVEEYSAGFRKAPSLPNIICETVNGVEFYQWYGTAMNA